MARMVQCKKLGKELPGLGFKPFPNELGQRLYDQVSMEGWGQWIQQSKMLVNEYRLNLGTKEAQEFLIEQMENAGLVSPMQTNGNREVLVPAGKGDG